MTLGLSLTFLSGPYVQSFTVNAISSEETSIYETLNSDGVAPFITLDFWLAQALTFQYLLACVFAVAASWKHRTPRAFFFAASVASAMSWMAIDLYWSVNDAQFSGSELVQNVFANLAGGLILGAVLSVFRIASEMACGGTPSNLTKIAAALTPLVLGLTLSCSLYYVSRLFFDVAKSHISVVFEPPVHGYLRVAKGESGVSHDDQFGLFSRPRNAVGELSWTGLADESQLTWTRGADSRHDVQIALTTGCIEPNQETLSEIIRSGEKHEDVDSILVEIDKGMASLHFVGGVKGEVHLKEEDLTQYTIGNTVDGRQKVTVFLSQSAELSEHSTGDAYYLLNVMSHVDDKETLVPTRTMNVSVNGNAVAYDLDMNAQKVNYDDSVLCKALLSTVMGNGSIRSETSLLPGLAIKISRTEQSITNFRRKNSLSIGPANGWVEFTASPENVDRALGSGYVERLIVTGKAASLAIDGENTEPAAVDSFQLFGHLYIDITMNGAMRVQGDADAIFRNGVRASRTRWERLDWELRLLLLGGIPTAFGLFFSAVRRRLGENNVYSFPQKS